MNRREFLCVIPLTIKRPAIINFIYSDDKVEWYEISKNNHSVHFHCSGDTSEDIKRAVAYSQNEDTIVVVPKWWIRHVPYDVTPTTFGFRMKVLPPEVDSCRKELGILEKDVEERWRPY